MTLPLVLSIPHGSSAVPSDIRPEIALSQEQLLESVDRGTSEIFDSLPVLASIKADWARFVVDLNRAPDQLGPKGVIARIDYHGRPIFRPGREPSATAVRKRLQQYYWPYHQNLKKALDHPRAKLLIDCHSLDGVGPKDAPDHGNTRADIVLGNNGGKGGEPVPARGNLTCGKGLLELMVRSLEKVGLSVAINQPYPGGYITRHYGQQLAARGKAAVQVEINKELCTRPGRPGLDKVKLASFKAQILEALTEISRGLD
ncbi:MAG: N-formylglutamate amidohydrolase [Desulfarculaceae bacterium]|jgi:N-formylglutamate amidohydrolase